MLAILLLGATLRRKGIVDARMASPITFLILNVTAPCTIISNVIGKPPEREYLMMALAGVAYNLVLFMAFVLCSRRMNAQDRSFYRLNGTGLNIACFAMPFIQPFFSGAAYAAAGLFDVGNALMATGGTYALVSSMEGVRQEKRFVQLFRQMGSTVTFWSYIAVILISVLQIRLPDALASFTAPIGNANTFLAMFLLGLYMDFRMDSSNRRKTVQILALRYALAAVCAALVWKLAPFSSEMRKMLSILLFAPMASMNPSFTEKLGGDAACSATLNSVSIIIGLIAMTALACLIR